jgi:hypothetical protein
MPSGDSFHELDSQRLSGSYMDALTYFAKDMNWTAKFFRRKNPDVWGYYNNTTKQW